MEKHWQFYLSWEEAWEGMLHEIAQAKTSIDFEQFIFWNDAISTRFAELFIKKASEGVKVRLLCDTAGSYAFSVSGLAERLKGAGVDVRFFNDISPWRVTKFKIWVNRDHRKLCVIDKKVAFVGGVGVYEGYRDWRDTQVKLSGPVVYELHEAFEHMWLVTTRDQFIRFKNPRQTSDGFIVLTNAPHFRQRFIHRTFLDVIRHAKKSVTITTPYFVPDARFLRVIRLAARRGVEVKILIPLNTDHPYVDYAGRFYFSKCLKDGIQIYQYTGGMLHTKTIIIDDDWGSVGSSNIDNLSSFSNYELNVASSNKHFIIELKEHFAEDLRSAVPVSEAEWKRRSFFEKTVELASVPFGIFF